MHKFIIKTCAFCGLWCANDTLLGIFFCNMSNSCFVQTSTSAVTSSEFSQYLSVSLSVWLFVIAAGQLKSKQSHKLQSITSIMPLLNPALPCHPQHCQITVSSLLVACCYTHSFSCCFSLFSLFSFKVSVQQLLHPAAH